MVDYFAEVYLDLNRAHSSTETPLLSIKVSSQGHDRMLPVRAPTSNSYVMKPLDGHHNTYLHCFVVVVIFFRFTIIIIIIYYYYLLILLLLLLL